jgi:O-antigen/teichoic acid export membrane protein
VDASLWSIGAFGVGQALRFGGNLVLTRLLFPDVFGLVALGYTFVNGLQLFSDVGTGPAVVQSPRGDDPRFLDTAWTIQIIRGVLIALVACAIAWPVAAFYRQPLLVAFLPAEGVVALVNGFSSTALHNAYRHLRMKPLALLELGTQTVSIAVTILLSVVLRARLGSDDLRLVWAVFAGHLAGELARTVASHTLMPGHRNRLGLDPESRRDLFGFGRWVFVSTALMFLAMQSDRLVFAKMIPLELLGVYGVALALATLPAAAVQKLASSVLFPALSRLGEDRDLAAAFRRGRLPVLLGGAALVSGLAAAGPFFFPVLYDDRYAGGGWMVQLLAAASWFQILESTNGAALIARGRVRWLAAQNATKLASMALLLPIGFRVAGFPGALLGLVASDFLRYATSVVGAALAGLRNLRLEASFTVGVAACSAAGFLAGARIPAAPGRHGLVLAMIAAGAAGAGPWAVLAFRHWAVEKARRGGPAEAPAAASR